MLSLIDKISRIIPPDNSSLEIEARYFIDERKHNDVKSKTYSPEAAIQIAKSLIKKYGKNPSVIQQSINFIFGENIKQLVFVNGEQQKDKQTHYKKTKIISPLLLLHNTLPAARFAVNFETSIDEFSVTKAQLARIRLRYSIQIEPWKLEITLTKTINDFSNPAILKSAKAAMLFSISTSDFIEKAPWHLADMIEFELEYKADHTSFTMDRLAIINEIFDGVIEDNAGSHLADIGMDTSSLSSSQLMTPNKSVKSPKYQETIYAIAKLIRKNDAYRFKNAEGLKQLSNQVIELDKNMFLKNVLPSITKYCITDKVDGKRTLLYISDKSYAISDDAVEIPIKVNSTTITVLDTEFYENKYYIFDVLVFDGRVLINEPFTKRMEYFDKLPKSDLLTTKPFVKLTDSFQKEIAIFKKADKPYEIDGIILTPLDGMYDSMQVYKYKPIDKLSVDFLIKKCPSKLLGIKPFVDDGKTLYLLFNGIRGDVFSKLRMSFVRQYEEIFPGIDTRRPPRYMPIQFQASDKTFSYLFWSDDNTLDNQIGEFVYMKNKWILHKIRHDRQVELARGNYFGNNYKVAEMTWVSYEDPLLIETLDLTKVGHYFQEHDNPLQKPSRNFNSYVKAKIFEQFANSEWVMDLASGKGQDLFRYAKNGMRNTVFLEIDSIALQELISRKHDFSTSRGGESMAVYTHQIDLNEDFKSNIEKLADINIQAANMDLIMCHFAFHYLIANKKSLINILKFVNYWLKPGGRFVFTTFDGRAIVKLLNENKGNWTSKNSADQVKYSIVKQYATTFLDSIGQQIEVLLPFSNSKYYSEYLVNIDYIAEEAGKLGLSLELDQSFGDYLDTYKLDQFNGYQSMAADDKQYSSLYHCYTLYKRGNGVSGGITSRHRR
jgi:SAM-dependent methyltransferase